MIRLIVPFVIFVLIAVALVLWSSAYVVEEGQQAVVTQFGKVVGSAKTEANLYFKVPFIQEVHMLEKRMLPWDGAPENMQTRDKKRIFIDVWARWKIAKPETFFRALRSEQRGQKILDNLVDSAVRDVVAQHPLIDVVRSTTEPLVYEDEELARSFGSTQTLDPSGEPKEQGLDETLSDGDEEHIGRSGMEEAILLVAGKGLEEEYGIELLDVHIKRVNYVQTVKVTVYERMRSERLRVAKLFESQAVEEKNRILGETRKELDTIEGEMEQKSAEIKGRADATVIEMTAKAYGQSPEALDFYEFLRRLEIFKKSLDGNSRLILSTDSDIFQLLKNPGPVE